MKKIPLVRKNAILKITNNKVKIDLKYYVPPKLTLPPRDLKIFLHLNDPLGIGKDICKNWEVYIFCFGEKSKSAFRSSLKRFYQFHVRGWLDKCKNEILLYKRAPVIIFYFMKKIQLLVKKMTL